MQIDPGSVTNASAPASAPAETPLDARLNTALADTASDLAWELFLADFKQRVFFPDPDDPSSSQALDANGGW